MEFSSLQTEPKYYFSLLYYLWIPKFAFFVQVSYLARAGTAICGDIAQVKEALSLKTLKKHPIKQNLFMFTASTQFTENSIGTFIITSLYSCDLLT